MDKLKQQLENTESDEAKKRLLTIIGFASAHLVRKSLRESILKNPATESKLTSNKFVTRRNIGQIKNNSKSKSGENQRKNSYNWVNLV